MTLDLALIVALGFAVYRAARLVARDSIMEQPRVNAYVWAFDPETQEPRSTFRSYVYELIVCPYCCGAWFAVGAACMVYGWPWSNWHGGRWLLALAAIAGVQATITAFTAKAEDG